MEIPFFFSYDIYHVTHNRRQAVKGAGKVAQVLKVMMAHLYHHLFFLIASSGKFEYIIV